MTSDDASASVLAVVLTFNPPGDSLARCIASILRQTTRPSEILVVDNHSDEPVERVLPAEPTQVPIRVVRLGENTGPAGGFAAGMEEFLDAGHDHLWALDDDIQPDDQCLELLLADLHREPDRAAIMPAAFDASTGTRFPDQNGWWGVLLAREVVATCGFPRTDLFFSLEDQEYFIDRLPLAGYPLARSGSACVRVRARPQFEIAPWKFYYFSRNLTYRYLYDRRHIAFSTRAKSLLHELARWWSNAWNSDSERARKLAHFVRGLVDGVFGRLGKRIEPDRADRPRVL